MNSSARPNPNACHRGNTVYPSLFRLGKVSDCNKHGRNGSTQRFTQKKRSEPKVRTFSSYLQGKKLKANYEELKPNLPEPKNKGYPTSTPKET